MHLYDAHNHLQDVRFGGHADDLLQSARSAGVKSMVVNGSSEEDWSAVAELARRFPEVIPSFGYHPWYIKERSAKWEDGLTQVLDSIPSGIGEIGLDRWIKDYDFEDQQKVFIAQLQLAAERNLPVSIHCLQAWGKLLEILKLEPRPKCGFVLHSFGGPVEMIEELSTLGAYFSLPGYFAHERKRRQREGFLQVPRDRLLIETDAPDQSLPDDRVQFALTDPVTGKSINHPASLKAVYQFAAELYGEDLETLAERIEVNFKRVFGSVMGELQKVIVLCRLMPGPNRANDSRGCDETEGSGDK
jgi:TatD DNase family protein